MISGIILTTIFVIPVYVLLIWTYFCPEESLLLRRKWMYKDEPEFSIEVIRYTKFTSMTAMIGLLIILISLFFEMYVLGLVVIVFLLTLIIGAFIIFTDNQKS